MQHLAKTLLGFAIACAVVFGAQPAIAQNITTGTLSGVVMDSQKAVLPGAAVVAVHVPTGTTYEGVTQSDGRYTMLAVRVGGPYTVKAELSGFKTQEQTGILVGLGESRAVDFTLGLESVTETVNVVAQAQVIDTTRAGAAANIASEAIEALPSISRSINDFARTSPYFNTQSDSAGGADMISVAGRNNRYNSMQIDGAVNNDVFGLASTGTPGGQTGTQPVSLDVIQEIQLVVSPYDVRQGGFTGGGVNAITKSGSNQFHGSAYMFGRNQGWIGKLPGIATIGTPDPTDTKVGTFSDKQGGLTLGGPIVTNKAFFFGNTDWARKTTPVGYSASGTSGTSFSTPALVQEVVSIAKNTWGFDPGSLDEFSRPNNANKIFGRFDFNVSPRHQLTARVNYVDAMADIGTQYSTSYKLPSHFYHMTDKTVSSVGQLNSSFGKAFNELRVVYTRERNVRGGQPGFPNFPEVRVYLADNTSVYMGTEYSSQANKLNQDIVEVTDDLTYVFGKHTISVGTHNEFYKFYNLFIQNLYGSYTFSSAANFAAGIAGGYYHNFSNTSDPAQAAEFSVRQFGLYVGDQWRVKNNFTVTYGIRGDVPRFPDKPHANPLTPAEFGYATDAMPAPLMWSPRAGFNWDLSNGGARRQVRGGLGLFTGRTPYVWLSNQYGNTGVDFTSLSVSYNARNTIPFVANPDAQPTVVTGGTTGRQTINLIDPDYKYPTVIRTNLAFDHELGVFGLIGTAEVLYSKNVEEIMYQNLNYVQTGTSALPDGRKTVGKLDSNLNDVMLLSNTSDGTSWSLAYKLERPFRRGFAYSASYIYNRATSRNDGTSSVARSNWANNSIAMDTNNPELTRSNTSVGSRVNVSVTVPIPLYKGLKSSATLFYNGQQGRPYSLGFNGDANGDAATSNDLLYIPRSADEVVVYSSVAGQTATWDQLNAFIEGSDAKDYRGTYMPRNAGRAKWSNQVDFRYQVNVPTYKKVRAAVTLDITNVLNLLNKDWGWVYYGSFGQASLIGYGGVDAATGKVRYNLSTINSSTYAGLFTRDDLRSRWQAQIGGRISF